MSIIRCGLTRYGEHCECKDCEFLQKEGLFYNCCTSRGNFCADCQIKHDYFHRCDDCDMIIIIGDICYHCGLRSKDEKQRLSNHQKCRSLRCRKMIKNGQKCSECGLPSDATLDFKSEREIQISVNSQIDNFCDICESVDLFFIYNIEETWMYKNLSSRRKLLYLKNKIPINIIKRFDAIIKFASKNHFFPPDPFEKAIFKSDLIFLRAFLDTQDCPYPEYPVYPPYFKDMIEAILLFIDKY